MGEWFDEWTKNGFNTHITTYRWIRTVKQDVSLVLGEKSSEWRKGTHDATKNISGTRGIVCWIFDGWL